VTELARALRRQSDRVQRQRTRHPEYAVVRSTTPLAAELTEGRMRVTAGEDLILGQWVKRYHASHGLKRGDTLLVQLMSNGEWCATEVISTTRLNRDRLVPVSQKKKGN
jgi:hypothetical protein